MKQFQNGNKEYIIVKTKPKEQTKGFGIAGFVLAVLAVFLGWIPIFGWILWILGLVFSSIGLAKKHIGFAATGFFLSVCSLILIIEIYRWFASEIMLLFAGWSILSILF
jgi:hypothetical protein